MKNLVPNFELLEKLKKCFKRMRHPKHFKTKTAQVAADLINEIIKTDGAILDDN